MASEKNEGTLWIQDKSKHPKAPGYTGFIIIEGEKWMLSAWVNKIKDGQKAGQQIIRLRAERPNKNGEQHNYKPKQERLPAEPEERQLTPEEEAAYRF